MRRLLDDEAKAITQILALSPDDAEGGRGMRARVARESGGAPDFPLFGDPDFAVINRYGVYNPAGFNGRRVPHPAVFVIDRAGRVTWRFLNTDARIRAENADILEALDRIDP